MFAFFTGNIGVLHVVLFVFMRIPAFSISAITGRIPFFASADSGYCGFIGLCFEITFTCIESAFFIRPTSVGPVDHRDFGKFTMSVSFTGANSDHSALSVTRHEAGESVRWVLGFTFKTHPRVYLIQPVLRP